MKRQVLICVMAKAISIFWKRKSMRLLCILLCLTSCCCCYAAPVQWNENGHLYEAVLVGPSGISWTDAQNAAAAAGGYLVTITSSSENAFVYSLVSNNDNFWFTDNAGSVIGPWLGGYQYDKLDEPDGHWRWTTDEPWSYTNWSYGEGNNAEGVEDYLVFYGFGVKSSVWNDYPVNGWSTEYWAPGSVRGYIIETPEPATLFLLTLGGLALRRRK